SKGLALFLRSAQAGVHPFNNQAALKFRHCSENGKHHAPHRGRCVNALRQRHKVDSQRLELFQRRHKMTRTPGEPVELPHKTSVGVARTRILHKRVELRPAPASFRTTPLFGRSKSSSNEPSSECT